MEPNPTRVRVALGGQTIADRRHTLLLFESELQPMYYFPPEDVRSYVLEPADRHTYCPKDGEPSYLHRSRRRSRRGVPLRGMPGCVKVYIRIGPDTDVCKSAGRGRVAGRPLRSLSAGSGQVPDGRRDRWRRLSLGGRRDTARGGVSDILTR